MAGKKVYINTAIPKGIMGWSHVYKPDDTAPAGATWEPDGKYKLQVIYEPGELDAFEAKIRTAGKEFFGADYDADDFRLPWRVNDEDHLKENLRNKLVLMAKSKDKPKVVDAKKIALPQGVMVRSGDIVKAAVAISFYETTETVKDAKTKKSTTVKVRGSNLYLDTVQLLEKRAGGSGLDSLDEEDGYTADQSSSSNAGNDTPDNDDF